MLVHFLELLGLRCQTCQVYVLETVCLLLHRTFAFEKQLVVARHVLVPLFDGYLTLSFPFLGIAVLFSDVVSEPLVSLVSSP